MALDYIPLLFRIVYISALKTYFREAFFRIELVHFTMRLVSAWTATIAALLLPHLTAASSLTPPVLPLIVRNPYLSTWLQDARNPPWTEWPMFWAGEHVGFSVMASLPHERRAYPLLGRPHDSLNSRDHE